MHILQRTHCLLAAFFVCFAPWHLSGAAEPAPRAPGGETTGAGPGAGAAFDRPRQVSFEPHPVSSEARVPPSAVHGRFNCTGREHLLWLSAPEFLFLGMIDDSYHLTVFSQRVEQGVTGAEKLVAGDFDGDGCDDVLIDDQEHSRWRIGFGGATNHFRFDEIPFESYPFRGAALFAGDFDGDRKDDVAAQDTVSSDVFIVRDLTRRPLVTNGIGRMNPQNETVGAGDVDGDGRSEIIRSSLKGNVVGFIGFTLTTEDRLFPAFHNTWAVFPAHSASARLASGDFNGDGRDDVFAETGDITSPWVALSTATFGIEQSVAGVPRSSRFLGVLPGDFNGDGRTDLLAGADGSRPLELLASVIPAGGDARSKSRGPFVCLGYTNTPGNTERWGRMYSGFCPDGYAWFGLDDHGREGYDSLATIISAAECCKLPNGDILIDEHFFVEGKCPESSVATGEKRGDGGAWLVRCTRINRERYSLGPPSGGLYWGVGLSLQKQERRIEKKDIPVALRFALGRSGYSAWDLDGCVGSPAGSLLVEKSPGGCGAQRFSELRYRGAAGDPPSGTPVPMLPRCFDIENVFDPASGCSGAPARNAD